MARIDRRDWLRGGGLALRCGEYECRVNKPLSILIIAPTAVVVVALFMVLWHECDSARQSFVALISGIDS
jgi:hypothetical protein